MTNPGSHDPLFVRDRHWFRDSRRGTLLAGSPLTYFKCTPEGNRILDAIESGEILPTGHQSLTARLERAGAIHPVPGSPVNAESITVVIPALVRDSSDLLRLRTLVESLAPLKVLVIDDFSPVEVDFAASNLRVVRMPRNAGPGAARNEGLSHVDTDVVAFVDCDITTTSHDIRRLASLVVVGRAVLAAPRVSAAPDGAIGEYETHHSPLDMGSLPGVVSPRGRVPYVPSAVLVARSDSVRELRAFDATLRVGEDVDLVWRMVNSGKLCLYVPDVVCHHEPRPNVRGFAAQRRAYGRSAADLAARHPGFYSPYRAHLAATIPALLTVSGLFVSAALLVLPAIVWIALMLSGLQVSWWQRARIGFAGITSAVRLLARASRREWWPLLFCASYFIPTATVVLLLSIFAPLTWNLLRNRPRHPLAYCGLRLVDDAAYGLGVWAGIFRAGSLRALIPRISVRRSVAR